MDNEKTEMMTGYYTTVVVVITTKNYFILILHVFIGLLLFNK